MRFTLCLAALAASVATASPAYAQAAAAQAQGQARGVVLQPLSLTKNADLDFGYVISTAAAGTVQISADDSTRSATGGVTLVPNFPGNRGLFTGNGTANQTVNLNLTSPSVLVSTTNPVDTVSVDALVLDSNNSTSRTIGSTGVFQVGVGGTFGIAANQANGTYQANFNLTANYQ